MTLFLHSYYFDCHYHLLRNLFGICLGTKGFSLRKTAFFEKFICNLFWDKGFYCYYQFKKNSIFWLRNYCMVFVWRKRISSDKEKNWFVMMGMFLNFSCFHVKQKLKY